MVAAINLRGIAEAVGVNVMLTAIEVMTFTRAALLIAVGALLWLVNRMVEGPHEEVEVERLSG